MIFKHKIILFYGLLQIQSQFMYKLVVFKTNWPKKWWKQILTLPRYETTASWWAGAAGMAAIGVATVIGNGAVLVALRNARRAPSHYPLASLASADLLLGLFVLPVGAARELFVFHLNWALCSCWSTLDVLCCTASILSLCALGWERYCGITAPLARAKRTKHVKIYAALVWPVATLVAIPTIFVPFPKHFLPGEVAKACTVNTNVIYVFISTFFSFYLPACVMVTLYARILSALSTSPQIRAHRGRSPCVTQEQGVPGTPNKKAENPAPRSFLRDKIQKVTVFMSPKGRHLSVPGSSDEPSCPKLQSPSPIKNSGSPQYIMSRQRRATRTIVMLMSLFLICWTPFFIMLPIDSLCECVPEVAWQWCTWLGYANSALNPIVYAAASPSVRQALHKSFPSISSTKTTEIPLTPTARRVS